MDGVDVDKENDVIYKDGLYYIAVNNIKPSDLDKKHTLTVSDGNKTFTMKYCALSYCGKVNSNSKDEALKKLTASLYRYHKSVVDYFE